MCSLQISAFVKEAIILHILSFLFIPSITPSDLLNCEEFLNISLSIVWDVGLLLVLSNWNMYREAHRSSSTGRWGKWWLEVRSVTSLVQLNLEKAVGVQLVSEVWTNSSASANSRLRSVLTVLFDVRALGIKTSCWWWVAGISGIIDRHAESTRRFPSVFIF